MNAGMSLPEWISVFLPLAGGFGALCCSRREKIAVRLGQLASALGCTGWMADALLRFSGSLMTAIFMLAIGLTGLAAAIHAPDYLQGHARGKNGVFWLLFGLTLSAMMLVSVLENFIPFLIAWEVMGLASLGLVAFEYEFRSVGRAAWIYALSCEAGGMFLMYFYRLQPETVPAVWFTAAVLGFGLKAGLPFLHVWLPEAHPAAPAPVSALMSGAMIPLGFCGLFRFAVLPVCGTLPGWILLIGGMAGAFGGILSALPAKNLKRLLAYSSIENMGIIGMGFGAGLLGFAGGCPVMGWCGMSGALLHVFTHALQKGALFLGAGAVLRASGTLEIDELGGLRNVMPATARYFALAAAGICGLPPFAGFTGELLIYIALLNGILHGHGAVVVWCMVGTVALAMTGALAAAALVKAYSGTFAGLPRSEKALHAVPEKRGMTAGMMILVIPALLVPLAAPVLFPDYGILAKNAVFSLLMLVLFAGIRMLSRKTESRQVGTWDCGYAAPDSRMQYTGTAFIQPLGDLFNSFLRFRKNVPPLKDGFPVPVSADAEGEDIGFRLIWKPLFCGVNRLAEKIHHFQSGYLHLYILVMLIALGAMLCCGIIPWGGLFR